MVTILLIDAGQGGLDAVALSKVVSVTDGKVMEAELDPVPDQASRNGHRADGDRIRGAMAVRCVGDVHIPAEPGRIE
jgi:hypothetical protein